MITGLKDASTPIPYHYTWDINDASKVKLFLRCPRRFFYTYVLGWASDRTSIHLNFGTAWHLAKAHLLLNDYSEQSVNDAYRLFLAEYRAYFDESEDEQNFPKTPDKALETLKAFVAEFPHDHDNYEVMRDGNGVPLVEISGNVPIDHEHELSLWFRLDALMRNRKNGDIEVWDHKTGSRLTGAWGAQWHLNFSTLTYLHVPYCIPDIPNESIYGIKMLGSFFYKTMKPKFHRELVRANIGTQATWLFTAKEALLRMKQEYHRMADAKPTDAVMEAFPLNGEDCTSFNRICPYHAFCTSWSNPLTRCHEVPIGLKQEYWDTRKEDSTFELEAPQ